LLAERTGCRRANEALEGVYDRREEHIKTRAADLAGSKEQPVAAGESLKERLRFETLLFDISARFMAAPLDQIDSEIDNALKQIMEFFQVDRCALLELQKDKAFAIITHAAFGEGIEPISGEISLAELFPWCYEHLAQGEHINICRGDYSKNALSSTPCPIPRVLRPSKRQEARRDK
jgi:hypothetical protein